MFLKVVDTIVTQEVIDVNEELDNDRNTEGNRLSKLEQEELFDIYGEPLCGEPS